MYIDHIILLYFIPSIHTTLNAHSLYHITSLYTVHTTPVRAHSFSYNTKLLHTFCSQSATPLCTSQHTTPLIVHFSHHTTSLHTQFTLYLYMYTSSVQHHTTTHAFDTTPLHVHSLSHHTTSPTFLTHHDTAHTFHTTPLDTHSSSLHTHSLHHTLNTHPST